MNVLINGEFDGKGTESKALEACKAQILKTKSKVEVQFDKKGLPELDLQHDLASDIEAMDLEALPLSLFRVTVEGVPAIGRMVNRSEAAFTRLGLVLTPLDWEDESGVIEIMGDFTGADFPFLAEIAARMIRRSLKAMSYTHHPLTLFDLKQACGMVYDLQQGTEGAQELVDWVGILELVILEEEKEVKAKAKAEKKKASDAKKAEDKAAKKAKAKAEAKAKAAEAEDETPDEGEDEAPALTKAQKVAAAKAKAKAAKAKAKNSGKAKTATLGDLA